MTGERATEGQQGRSFKVGPFGICLGCKRWGFVIAIALRKRVS